jgi:hypothetical protein
MLGVGLGGRNLAARRGQPHHLGHGLGQCSDVAL